MRDCLRKVFCRGKASETEPSTPLAAPPNEDCDLVPVLPEHQPTITDPQPGDTQQSLEVTEIVPQDVRPGQQFTVVVRDQIVLVTCPPNAGPGQRVRFRVPINPIPPQEGSTTTENGGNESPAGLSWRNTEGWFRTIRLPDKKLQWTRVGVEDTGRVSSQTRFDGTTLVFVRQLEFLPGLDERMRSGVLSLVPAAELVVDSHVCEPDGREVVSYADIAAAQVKSFDDKARWFADTCNLLHVSWDDGHMQVSVRREYLLSDSMMVMMCLSRQDLRKHWNIEFIGEDTIDTSDKAQEWFHLVTDELFNPDNGLWQYSVGNQRCMDINPASEVTHPEDHLIYFRFLGRVLGKALFDNRLVSGQMARYLYKHLLGWPVAFDDLELVDGEIYKALKTIQYYDGDLSDFCLDFTVTENFFGELKVVELVTGGTNIEVTQENLFEYIESCLKYHMLGRVKPQLTELLLGFYDVLPEPPLAVFDFQELELLMCG